MNKFVDWLFEPLINKKDIEDTENIEVTEEVTPEVTLPIVTKKAVFRPSKFSEYIGQDRLKEHLTHYIKAIKQRNQIFPHTLIYGKAGMGKTTLVKIIANEMGVPMKEIITSDIDQFWKLKLLITECNGGIVFLDEIHSIDRNTAEKIYTIMEDFTYQGENIQPFTLIGATTEYGEMLETRKPFCDRFKIAPPVSELDDYTIEDMARIGKQYKQSMFPEDEMKDDVYLLLAKNSRGTPRTIIRLIETTIYLGSVEKVLNIFGIIKNGYTKKDLMVLKYISQNDKGVGLQSIGSYLDSSVKNYLYQIEPFLLRNNLVLRTPRGRKISPLGLEKIKELEQ